MKEVGDVGPRRSLADQSFPWRSNPPPAVTVVNDGRFFAANFYAIMVDRISSPVAEELPVSENLTGRSFQQIEAASFARRKMTVQRPAVMDLRGTRRRLAPEDQR